MNKIIVVLVMIIFAGCSQKQDILVTKKVYPDISKNAVFDAAKTLFTLSNKENGNKSFIVDVYRDKIEVNKIIFEDNIIKVDIVLDKWILELYQVEKETRANLIVIRRDGLNKDDIEYIDENDTLIISKNKKMHKTYEIILSIYFYEVVLRLCPSPFLSTNTFILILLVFIFKVRSKCWHLSEYVCYSNKYSNCNKQIEF